MHHLVVVLTLLIMLSGCTSFVDSVTDEPIQPDPTGKSIGKDFTKAVYEKLGTVTFKKMIEIPPNTKELKDPQLYLKKLS